MGTFKKDIEEGLGLSPKTLPSKYFYDKDGDELFVKIMHLPEYYLTRCELEIFKTQSEKIIENLQLNRNTPFELIELGPGDGLKTKELLKVLLAQGYYFKYLPIDISPNALNKLEKILKTELPQLNIEKLQGDYFEKLETLKSRKQAKVLMFLGSNIGNMIDEVANQFICDLSSNLSMDDKFLLGVDLIKDRSIVLPAYDDKAGVTREFNLNLLRRINRELDADFELKAFVHAPEYTEEKGVAISYLMSTKVQSVKIKKLGKTIYFEKGEKILTEISRKYSDEIISQIIVNSGFLIQNKITDSKGYFADYILKKV